jgi:hypothetical protein
VATLEIFDQLWFNTATIFSVVYLTSSSFLIVFHKIILIIFDQENALSLSYTSDFAALIYFPEAVLSSAVHALL